MPRPSRLSAEQEEYLKFEMLFDIKEWDCKTTTDLTKTREGYNSQQLQYYMNKFHLSFRYPYAFADDLVAYEIWYDKQEAAGVWFGDKTTLEAIIESEKSIDDALKAGRMITADVNYTGVPILGKAFSFKDMIEAAKTNPHIKTLGDWETYKKMKEAQG